MAWTQSDVDTLKAAIASGLKRVTFSDHTAEYQDTASMLKALQKMEAEVAATAGTATSRTILVQHGKGL